MKIAILSVNPRCYSTRRLREAAAERGHSVKVLNTLKFSLSLEQAQPELYFRNRRISAYDAVIPRIGSSITVFGTSVVRQFQQMGVFCANTANSINNSRDKLRALQILSKHDIGIAPTAYVRDKGDILAAIERVGGAPVIIKLIHGTQGMGVILAENQKVAEAIIETLYGAKQSVLVQKFVSESKGRDIRAFVVGDKVVAAMRRVAQGQEFRSNIHRGGRAEKVELDAEYTKTAVRAAQLLGLRVAGVDILESKDGPQVIEVNSSPGLEGIETCTGVDVAGAIIDYIVDQVTFPELDIRERLTVAQGYGVGEFWIAGDSPMVGKPIQNSGLWDEDISVLWLERDGVTYPNPKPDFCLFAGDHLLCFGRMSGMKHLLPPPKRRKRKKAATPLSA